MFLKFSYFFSLSMFLALNVFSAPELDIVTAEKLEASFYQPMTDDQQECDDTSVGQAK